MVARRRGKSYAKKEAGSRHVPALASPQSCQHQNATNRLCGRWRGGFAAGACSHGRVRAAPSQFTRRSPRAAVPLLPPFAVPSSVSAVGVRSVDAAGRKTREFKSTPPRSQAGFRRSVRHGWCTWRYRVQLVAQVERWKPRGRHKRRPKKRGVQKPRQEENARRKNRTRYRLQAAMQNVVRSAAASPPPLPPATRRRQARRGG